MYRRFRDGSRARSPELARVLLRLPAPRAAAGRRRPERRRRPARGRGGTAGARTGSRTRSRPGARTRPAAPRRPAPAPAPRPPRRGRRRAAQAAPGRRGAHVENMEASLRVPTATSVRNGAGEAARGQPPDPQQPPGAHRQRQGQLHAPHRVRGRPAPCADFPTMNSGYAVDDGKPVVVRHEHVNLGLAVDQQKRDGSRTLLVPNVKGADTIDFAAFCERVRGADPQGPHQPDLGRRLRRHHRHHHEPRHDRDGPLGPAAHARAGLHPRRRRDRRTRPSTRAPTRPRSRSSASAR